MESLTEHIDELQESIYMGEQQFGLFEGLGIDEIASFYPKENEYFMKGIKYRGR